MSVCSSLVLILTECCSINVHIEAKILPVVQQQIARRFSEAFPLPREHVVVLCHHEETIVTDALRFERERDVGHSLAPSQGRAGQQG